MEIIFLSIIVIIDGVIAAQQNRVQDVVDMSAAEVQADASRFGKVKSVALRAALTPPSQYLREAAKYLLTAIAVIAAFSIHWYAVLLVLIGIIVVYVLADWFLPFKPVVYRRRIAATLASRKKLYDGSNHPEYAELYGNASARFKELYDGDDMKLSKSRVAHAKEVAVPPRPRKNLQQ